MFGARFCFDPESVKSISKVRYVKKRTTVCLQGEDSSNIFYLAKGSAMTSKNSEGGRVRITRFIKEGEFFGTVTLFSSIPYTMNLTTFQSSTVYIIQKSGLEKLLLESPELIFPFYLDMVKKLQRTAELVIDNYLTAEERIYKTLVFFAETFGEGTGKGNYRVSKKLTHNDIAGLSGTTRVTVTKTLSRLTEQGIVVFEENPWTIWLRRDGPSQNLYNS